MDKNKKLDLLKKDVADSVERAKLLKKLKEKIERTKKLKDKKAVNDAAMAYRHKNAQ